MHKQRMITLGTGLVGLVSVFLPWMTIDAFQLTMNVNGFGRGETPTDAFVSLILFGVMIALSFIGDRQEAFSNLFRYMILSTALGSFLFGLVEFFAVNGKVREVGVQLRQVTEASYRSGSVGYGIYLNLLAGLLALIWMAWPLVRERLENR